MSQLKTLIRGENLLVIMPLFLAGGTVPFPVASLASAKVSLLQGDTVVASYTHGSDDELRTGSQTHYLVLEITEELSLQLQKGIPLEIERALNVADADFSVDDGMFKDRDRLPILMIG